MRAEVAVELPNLDIEQIYQERLQRMSPAEKFARSAAMFQWTRDQISRQILQERGAIEAEELKWLWPFGCTVMSHKLGCSLKVN